MVSVDDRLVPFLPRMRKEEKAEAIFVKASEAYAVLSDDEKRRIHDQYGKRGSRGL